MIILVLDENKTINMSRLLLLLFLLLVMKVILCYKLTIGNDKSRKFHCNTNNNIWTKDLFEGDIVELKKSNKDIELAAVIKVNKDKSVMLHPLCIRPTEDTDDNDKDFVSISSLLLSSTSSNNKNKEIELYYDETINSISILFNEYDSIINIIRDGVSLTQRVIEDRISNPHGEHSEDCWLLNLNSVVFSNNNYLKINIRLPEH